MRDGRAKAGSGRGTRGLVALERGRTRVYCASHDVDPHDSPAGDAPEHWCAVRLASVAGVVARESARPAVKRRAKALGALREIARRLRRESNAFGIV